MLKKKGPNKNLNNSFLLFSLILSGNVWSQDLKKTVDGFVMGDGDFLEGVHLYTNKFENATISDSNGRFSISATVGDTLYISSVNFETKKLVVNNAMIASPSISVGLLEKIYNLDEVIVRPFNLTGFLNVDAEKETRVNQVNSSLLGLPNANVRVMGKSQRMLHEATDGRRIFLSSGTGNFGLTFSFNRIINGISGRTKRLKENIELENEMIEAERLRTLFPSTFFNSELGIPPEELYLFIFFCQNDDRFSDKLNNINRESLVIFLKEKSSCYLRRSFPSK